METRKLIETYLDNIKEEFGDIVPETDFIDSLRQDLYEYCENHPNSTLSDLEEEFGTAEQIVLECTETIEKLSPKEVKKQKNKRNIVIALLLLIICIGAILFADILGQTQSQATDVIFIED